MIDLAFHKRHHSSQSVNARPVIKPRVERRYLRKSARIFYTAGVLGATKGHNLSKWSFTFPLTPILVMSDKYHLQQYFIVWPECALWRIRNVLYQTGNSRQFSCDLPIRLFSLKSATICQRHTHAVVATQAQLLRKYTGL